MPVTHNSSPGGGGQGVPTGGATGQVLNKVSGTDFDTQWATPVTGDANVQADWNAVGGDAFILNKPVIPTVPTVLSAFTNDLGFTGDQTGVQIKSLYEAEANTNAFTDTEKTKLSGLASVASSGSYNDLSDKPSLQKNNLSAIVAPTSTDDASAAYAVGSLWIDTTANEAYRCVDAAVAAAVWINTTLTTAELATVALTGSFNDLSNKPVVGDGGFSEINFASSLNTKLGTIETNAKDDQTGTEIKIAYEGEADTNAYTDAEKTKLGGISPNAEVNVQADWGAVSGDAFIANKPTALSQFTDDLSYLSDAPNDGNTYGRNNASWVIVSGGGPLNFAAFAATTIYVQGQVIVEALKLYEAKVGFTTGASFVAADWDEISAGGGGSMSNLVEDTTPQLGANLDTQSFTVDGRDVGTDGTKLDTIASNANNYGHPNHTGDVTSVADGAMTIANDAVTNAKMANVATSTIKGRVTAATGDVEDLTASQVRTLINVENGATADQTGTEIKAAYELEANTNPFTDSQKTAVDGLSSVAGSGDYNDLINKPNLQQNKLDATIAPVATDDSGAGYAVGSIWIDVTGNEAYRCIDATAAASVWINTTLTTAELATVAMSGAYSDLSGKPVVGDGGLTQKNFTTSLGSKLTGIESSATADQTGAEIKTAYEAEPNAYTDTKDTKLTGITTGATANDTDANLKNRANHTGTQDQSTVTNSAGITDYVQLTQAAYDALSPPVSTIAYYIVG